jgi:uncharacterized membrane protein
MSTTAVHGSNAYQRDATVIGAGASADRMAAAQRRVVSIDIVRGVVMLLMAIDHVRVYSGQPAGGPTPGIFFTRWITHFVAPAFVFLAGTSAYLYGQRVGDTRKLARFLLTRGLWLVLLELTVLRVGWTFNFDFAHYLLAGVIWMIGWCMVLMSAIVFLPRVVIGVGSVAMIVGHNITDFFPALAPALRQSSAAWLWKILYLGGGVQLGAHGPPLIVLFVIVPWIGVMAAGYAFGPVMRASPERRRSVCLRLGLAMTAAFILLRGADVYGDPRHWRRAAAPPPASQTARAAQPTAAPATAPATAPAGAPARRPPNAAPRPQMPKPLAFLNTAKYPASLSFLLMTLGPMFVLLALVDGASGRAARVLETFGRVPFLYYILHIPLIHAAACVVSVIREGAVNPWLFTNHPMANPPAPPGYTWSLPLLYLVWAIVVVVLYAPCRWFARVRAESGIGWLRYL